MRLLNKLLLAAALSLSAISAQAATAVFTSDHCTGGCGPQPGGFATLEITDNGSGTLHFAYTLLNGNTFANGGQAVVAGFNLIGNPTITYSNISSNLFVIPNVIPVNQQPAGTLAANGLGNFEYGLEGNFNGASSLSTLSFDITGAGLTLLSIAERSTTPPGDTPAFFGLDIFSGTTRLTGFVDVTGSGVCPACTPFDVPPSEVPLPGAVWLFGAGLSGLYWLQRRRKKTPPMETQPA